MPSPVAGTAAQHLIVPFAGRLGPACRAALPSLALPRLETLLARLRLLDEDAQPEDSLSPPHERALARALGVHAGDGCLPWAALDAVRHDLPGARDQPWAWVTLCHWQVGLSEVVLGDPSRMGISAGESQALLATVGPFFEEDGIALFASGQPGCWLARGAPFDALPTAALERVIGQPLGPWLPMSDAARALRRLQNEMQMLLYTHPVNDERTARGAWPVNSFWLSGSGRAPGVHGTPAPEPTVAHALREAALHDDGAAWAAAWQALDAGAIAALADRAWRGADELLTLCGERAARRYGGAQGGLRGWLRQRFGQPRAAAVLEAL